ncbi:MAG: PDZ domain-containing protein [Planctomycetota bacterium]
MRTATLVLVLSAAALAGDPPSEIVRKLLATTDAAERAALVNALVAAAPDPREVATWFAEGRVYAAEVPTGWLKRMVKGSDGKERPYLLYVPENYAPGRKYRFLVDMHGGVSQPRPLNHRELEQMKFFWAEEAETQGWFLAIPSGEKGAEWWTAVGSGNVLSILDKARSTYDIDENLVFATGFSDGGSGSFYLGLAAPHRLAGIIPLNGHIGVAQAGGLEVHLRTLRNIPIYAVNTENDRLYPPDSMKPLIDALKDLGAPVTWREIAGFGHDPSYLPAERPAITGWIVATRRDPQPKSIVWEGTGPCRIRWLNVTELGSTRNEAPFPDINPKLPPSHPRIGVVVDEEFAGTGVLVREVQGGSPAADAGIAAGDVLLGIDDKGIGDMADLQRVLRGKKPGDGFKLRLRRGEETLEKQGMFPEARPEPAFRRGQAYGSIQAEVKDNVVEVRARGIRAFELLPCEPLFDLSKPVTVRVNGQTVHAGVVAPDLRFLAEQAAADADRTVIPLARLKIALGS